MGASDRARSWRVREEALLDLGLPVPPRRAGCGDRLLPQQVSREGGESPDDRVGGVRPRDDPLERGSGWRSAAEEALGSLVDRPSRRPARLALWSGSSGERARKQCETRRVFDRHGALPRPWTGGDVRESRAGVFRGRSPSWRRTHSTRGFGDATPSAQTQGTRQTTENEPGRTSRFFASDLSARQGREPQDHVVTTIAI